jgi:hypothetical protein
MPGMATTTCMHMNDPSDLNAPLRKNLGLAVATLAASSGTLVCCVLPAAMVALGAGASLAGLVTAFPQLIWLSEHKALVFGIAFMMLALSGLMQWRARRLPCPTDPRLAQACATLRRWSNWLWILAMATTFTGAVFAFILPLVR